MKITLKLSPQTGEFWKCFESEDYNYRFNLSSGKFIRWGRSLDDDPVFSPYGPELADIELTTQCYEGCMHCYKANTPKGEHMSLDTFKAILSKFPKYNGEHFLTQIAFGVDAEATANPDIWRIFEHCRKNNIIPNLTVARITEETAKNIAKWAGACAVSRYNNKNICYDAVKLLTDNGLKQVTIHQLVAKPTLSAIFETLEDIKHDPRLANLKAIVFLMAKQKGRGVHLNSVTADEFKQVTDKCAELGINYGCDSCGAPKLMAALSPAIAKLNAQFVEPCEATKTGAYINVEGKYFPCSFIEGENLPVWRDGLDVLTAPDFLSLWNHTEVLNTRNNIITAEAQQRGCYHFNV
jgi:hypothetical protein